MTERQFLAGADMLEGAMLRGAGQLFPYVRLLQVQPRGGGDCYEFELDVARTLADIAVPETEGTDPNFLRLAHNRVRLLGQPDRLPRIGIDIAHKFDTPLKPILTEPFGQLARSIGVEWHPGDIERVGKNENFVTYETPARYGTIGLIALGGQKYAFDVRGFLLAGLRLAFAESLCWFEAEDAAQRLTQSPWGYGGYQSAYTRRR